MRNLRKMSLVMALLMLIISLLTSCKQSEVKTSKGKKGDSLGILNSTGFPITKEPVDLTFFVGKSINHGDFNDLLIMQEYEKMTNLNINWKNSDTTSDSQLREKINIELTTNAPNDAYFKVSFDTKNLMSYGQQGKFIALNDLIDNYAPNLKKLLDEYPEVRKGITMPDGKIYGFPNIINIPMGIKIFINSEWLKATNYDMPKTTDELYNILKAFKMNLKSKDEVPLTAAHIGHIIGCLSGAWGLRTRGNRHLNVDINEETGELRFIPTDERYKDMLLYLRKLYNEGLLDPEIFTINHSKFVSKVNQGLVGVSAHILHRHDSMVGLEEALEGPYGDKKWSAFGTPLASAGTFVITDHNPHPEATVRWVDYFYGEEGATFYHMGIEGVTYRTNPDNTLEYLDKVLKSDGALDSDQALGRFLPWVGGRNPSYITGKWFKGGETEPQTLKASENMSRFKPREIWEKFTYTADENDSIVALENDILTYVDEMRARFIINNGEIESLWDEYVKTINDMGLSKYMSIYKAAYERYNK